MIGEIGERKLSRQEFEMRKLVLIASGLLVLTFGSVCVAEEEQEKDFLEASIFGGLAAPTGGISGWSDSLGAKSGFTTGVEIGYFMTPSMVLGLTFSYNQFPTKATDEAASLHHRLYNPAIYAKHYFFSESHFAPYFKVQAGVDNPKFATSVYDGDVPKYREMSYDPAFAIGGGAGLFYYTSDVSGFFVEANLHHAFSKDVNGTYQNQAHPFGESSTFFDIHAGLAVFFGSSK